MNPSRERPNDSGSGAFGNVFSQGGELGLAFQVFPRVASSCLPWVLPLPSEHLLSPSWPSLHGYILACRHCCTSVPSSLHLPRGPYLQESRTPGILA